MRILAVCTANIARSILFEYVFSQIKALDVKSCGIYPAKKFNQKALDFYDQRKIVLTKQAPESFSVYQWTTPFDVVIYLSNKAVEIPRDGFGEPINIQSEFNDPLTGSTSFEELYNNYNQIAERLTPKAFENKFDFAMQFLNSARIIQNG